MAPFAGITGIISSSRDSFEKYLGDRSGEDWPTNWPWKQKDKASRVVARLCEIFFTTIAIVESIVQDVLAE